MNFNVKCHVYPYTVYFFVNKTLQESKEECEKLLKAKVDLDMSKFGALTLFPNEHSNYQSAIILLERNKTFLQHLHHECIHAANWILSEVGVEIQRGNDESLAYLSSYIFQQALNKTKLKIQNDNDR